MNRRSIYDPVIQVPLLSGPEVKEIDVSSGIVTAGERIVKALALKEQQDAAVYAERSRAQIEAEAMRMDRQAEAAGPVPPGHVVAVGDRIAALIHQTLDAAPNHQARDRLARSALGLHEGAVKAALKREAGANITRRHEAAHQALNDLEDLAIGKPSDIARIMAQAKELESAALWTPEQRRDLNRAKQIPLAALENLYNRDPIVFRDELEKGHWSAYLTDEETERAKQLATQRIAQEQELLSAAAVFNEIDQREEMTRYGREVVAAGRTPDLLREVWRPSSQRAEQRGAEARPASIETQRMIGEMHGHASLATLDELDGLQQAESRAAGTQLAQADMDSEVRWRRDYGQLLDEGLRLAEQARKGSNHEVGVAVIIRPDGSVYYHVTESRSLTAEGGDIEYTANTLFTIHTHSRYFRFDSHTSSRERRQIILTREYPGPEDLAAVRKSGRPVVYIAPSGAVRLVEMRSDGRGVVRTLRGPELQIPSRDLLGPTGMRMTGHIQSDYITNGRWNE